MNKFENLHFYTIIVLLQHHRLRLRISDHMHLQSAQESQQLLAGVLFRIAYCLKMADPFVEFFTLKSSMIWTEEKARQQQVEQVGTSACGATAALNVLTALGLEAGIQDAIEAVHTRQRDLEAPLPQYLLSRSVAGTTHSDIICGIKSLSKNQVDGQFFHFYPERDVDVTLWLKKWIDLGAVPVVTLNCQKILNPDGTRPDAWHHQMVYGVSNAGIHMTNPCQILDVEQLLKQLCSESILLIRSDDVIVRWDVNMDITSISSGRWKDLRVAEQIERLIKDLWLKIDYQNDLKYQEFTTSHLTIPAAYQSGITIFAKTDSQAYTYLQCSEELPIKQSSASDS